MLELFASQIDRDVPSGVCNVGKTAALGVWTFSRYIAIPCHKGWQVRVQARLRSYKVVGQTNMLDTLLSLCIRGACARWSEVGMVFISLILSLVGGPAVLVLACHDIVCSTLTAGCMIRCAMCNLTSLMSNCSKLCCDSRCSHVQSLARVANTSYAAFCRM
jgi:hypothetical protein